MNADTDWHIRARCKCGWHIRAPFSSLLHIHKECCPKCGEDKNTWKLVKMKLEKQGWFKPLKWIEK